MSTGERGCEARPNSAGPWCNMLANAEGSCAGVPCSSQCQLCSQTPVGPELKDRVAREVSCCRDDVVAQAVEEGVAELTSLRDLPISHLN